MSDLIWRPTELPIDPSTMRDVGFGRMRVTSPYGRRLSPINGREVFHDGLDIGNAREGDWLTAVADGVVVIAGTPGQPWSSPATVIEGVPIPEGNWGGYMVVIEHDGPDGKWCSVTAHMQPTLLVKPGDRVKMGQRIGKVGATGSARIGGAHTHHGHIMCSAAECVRLGAGVKPTRDPWAVIEPDDPLPVRVPTRLERLKVNVRRRRLEKPKAAARWVARTGLTVEDDGKVLTQLMRLSAENSDLMEARDE